jgi:hypothetical protein
MDNTPEFISASTKSIMPSRYMPSRYTEVREDTIFSLQHVPPDDDGFYNGLIYPATHNKLVWVLSWSSLPAGIYALTRGYYDLSAVPLGVFATSLMYWTKPERYSCRRYLDMTYVGTALLYQGIRSVGAEHMIWYYIVLCIALCCYPVSEFYHDRHSWAAALFHGGIHVFGNVANVILYSGYIPEKAG